LRVRTETREHETSAAARRRLPFPELLVALFVAAVLLRGPLERFFESAALRNWVTIFLAIVIQALPFLTLGVVLSGAIAALVPPEWLARVIPKRTGLAVPMAGLAGVALPGCECGAVPIAGRLMARGAPAPAALAFLLAAPAINPVVIVSTAVAFPGRPSIVVARFGASLATAIIVGLIWAKIGKDIWIERAMKRVSHDGSKFETFAETAQHDFLHAGGFLVVGGITAATLQTVIPKSLLDSVAGSGFVSVLVLAVLAVVLAICSEADAFVAAGLHQFSLTARLVFLVVGPAVDVKLVSLQAGTFSRAFAARFAPLTFVVAIATSLIAGWLLL
jgi:uncharacterized protein